MGSGLRRGVPEYRISPAYSTQQCPCKPRCELYETMRVTHDARLLALDDPEVRGLPMERAWMVVRYHGSDLDELGHADRRACAAYTDHLHQLIADLGAVRAAPAARQLDQAA